MKKHKVIFSVILLILMIPIGYITFGHKYIDNVLYNDSKNDINNFIENKYTGSIKDGVTENDLKSVNNKINFIYDKQLKNKLLSETDSIVKQANLQTSIKSETNKYYDSKSPNDITESRLNELIDLSGSIKNNDVRIKILQKNYDVLDRIQKNNKASDYVKKLVDNKDSLTVDSFKDYFIAVGLVNSIYYDETKKSLENSLSEIDDILNKKITDSNKNEEDLLNNQINSVKNGSYIFEEFGSKVNKITPIEYQSYDFFIKNEYFKYLIVINNNNIYIFENNASLNNKAIKTDNVKNNLPQKSIDEIRSNYVSGLVESDLLVETKNSSNSNNSNSSSNSSESSESSNSSSEFENKYIKVISSTGTNPIIISSDSEAKDALIVSKDTYDFIKSIINSEVGIIG